MDTANSLICVGLDPQPARTLPDEILDFNARVIEATAGLVCAYKPQWAFYEAEGIPGIEALQATIEAVPDGVPVLLDAKRGDMDNTARAYAKAAFEQWGADALTVNPYQGHDAVQPFLDYADRGVFVLARTSNPGSAEFQNLTVRRNGSEGPLYEEVARQAVAWNDNGNIGLVVGATAPDELARVRSIVGSMPILIPGIGAQGGDLEAAVRNGTDANGRRALIAASRSVIYASKGEDFAEAARAEAQRLRDAINAELERMGTPWP